MLVKVISLESSFRAMEGKPACILFHCCTNVKMITRIHMKRGLTRMHLLFSGLLGANRQVVVSLGQRDHEDSLAVEGSQVFCL